MTRAGLVFVAGLAVIGCRSSSPPTEARGDSPAPASDPAQATAGCRVEGCVREPGAQSLAGYLTVLEAIQAAGPIAGRSDLAHVQLVRGSAEDRVLIVVDVRSMLATGDSRLNVLLQPGDILHVPELPDLPEPGDG